MKKLHLIFAVALTLLLCSCGHTHEYTEEIIPPTCTEDGYTIFTCECGETYNDRTVKAAHTKEALPAKAATCTEDGLTEGKACAACGEVLLAQEPLLAAGHQYGNWYVIKDATHTETGTKGKDCAVCGNQITEEIPLQNNPQDDPYTATYTVTYDLNGGCFVGGYTLAELQNAFLADFNRYGDGSVVTKENFQSDSHPCVKTSLSNADMLAKWNWLWVYMLEHLQEYNKGQTSAYITDTYPILKKMINGDTNAIHESPNARTSIRSYIHGFLNAMKGCGDVNRDFSQFSPDFSLREVQEEFLKHQYSLSATLSDGEKLPEPIREGYQFIGWEDSHGNSLHKATGNGTLTAIWKEQNPVEKIEITNRVTEIALYEAYRLEWAVHPGNAGNQRVRFESDDTTIAKIDENGRITTYRVGEVTIRIISLSEHGHTDTMTVRVVTPGYFDMRYETTSYVTIGESIRLHAAYIDPSNQTHAVTWKSLDEAIAVVDNTGCVIGKAAGTVKIRATAAGNDGIYRDFVVTVLSKDLSEGMRLVLDAHESNVFVKHDLPIGAGTPNYYSDVFGSVSRLLYNHDLVIDDTYNQRTNQKYGADLKNRVMESIEFITVHYTAGFSAGADGNAHGEWFSQPLSENNTSIHYSTGNDGVFKGLDEQYRAAHAGDAGSFDTVAKFSWIDTPLRVLDTDPEFPIVTITTSATFAINGRDTGVKVPRETRYGRGYVTDSKWLNAQGIAVNVKDGYYQIGTSWWCYTQISEGRICSNGGNHNSIGIESAVNKGSDLWYTWQITAQLVADIMVRHDLDITRVKGHHFFSAKDCPQPLLENDLEIWWEFIELVKAEYQRITACADYTFSFACDSELVNEHGRVTHQANDSQIVTYKVTVTKDGKEETVELASVIRGAYHQ